MFLHFTITILVRLLKLDTLFVVFHDRKSIHPFQDGNGRVGRLIFFKECLRNRIVPFIIEDDMKMFIIGDCMSGEMKKGIFGIPVLQPRTVSSRILITTGSHTDAKQKTLRDCYFAELSSNRLTVKMEAWMLSESTR